ncbi:MAG: TIGR00153 family protein [Xanthomonadales bacterium]|nr:TIGR00153 family protein [Gammaproteobacteria bacterium]NNE06121.1 TIGR00153 family protein [Xanthomonadales bacterium]NNL94798.1 TIGR00153 family protein [Xanthomonadales bacterium]
MAGSYLSGIFGSSPVRPLQKHMEQIVACVRELVPYVDSVLEGNIERRNQHHEKIVDLEHKADDLKKELRLHLPSSLFMPIDRRDVLEVLTMQDRVAGAVRDVAGIIVGRDIQIPAEMSVKFRELVVTCVKSVEEANDAICELDELIETGFGDNERERVGMLLTKLDATEQLTDEQSIELSHKLYEIEDDLKPVNVMFLYRIIDKTSAIADRAQRVGSRLQLMLAR